MGKLISVVKNVIKKDLYDAEIKNTTTALTAVENKIPNVSDLVRKEQIMMQK